MEVITSDLRAIIERVTEVKGSFELVGIDKRIFVFEHLDRKGGPCKQWIQDWECNDITRAFNQSELYEIFDEVQKYHKNK